MKDCQPPQSFPLGVVFSIICIKAILTCRGSPITDQPEIVRDALNKSGMAGGKAIDA